MEITANNVNNLYEDVFWRLRLGYDEVETRNGPAVRFPEPVMTTIKSPRERVLFHPKRDANPIFHLLEAVWMLAGRNDVEFVKLFNSRINLYSDDGKTFNAAYGFRMREHFGKDQLVEVIEELSRDGGSRQAVIQLWDAKDLGLATLDKACNTQMMFEVHNRKLNLLVTCRSNDIFWGYAGANAVHFTVIQEFVADALGVEMGVYRTVSNNLHLYLDLYDGRDLIDNPPYCEKCNYYNTGEVVPGKLIHNRSWREWLLDAEEFCEDPFVVRSHWDGFFKTVAHPMAMISRTRKTGWTGYPWAKQISAPDWKVACTEWIDRRERAKAEK
jgi:thymidylate synthase